ncbi:uncharacterized protein HD556DRAFT_1437003 [Suillus plorans]|uniref:Uncharacterized protein n=1 Tax=Suillus plorans TaxID=116603 RepID=A0A9P7DWB7_9AGAM|nr:uncharacterized protein HD556DRAFT_1437003 [Suillus plorans]KAG1804833.1 hypothetical protein HD556DRAFT_1437003 [Suillus plorans]
MMRYSVIQQQDDRTLYNINVISRVLNHHLISVWTWLDLELNFSTKLARWPMGFYWQPAFTTAMSFDGTTYGHLTDYTVGSYDSQSGYLNVIPSPGAHGPSTSPSIPSEDLMQPLGSTSNFSEELSWPANMKIIGEHASLCQTVLANLPLDNPWTNIIQWFKICVIGGLVAGRYGHAMEVVKLPGVRHQFLTQCFLEALSRSGMSYDDCKSVDLELVSGTRFHWHHLREQYNHKPNNFASDWHKIIGHCLQPGQLMDFSLDTQLVSDSADYDIIGEIIGLQMAKEIWHHIVLRPVASNPSISIADVYWNQILDQQGDVSLEAITFIFYEWCQKALNVTLDRTTAANIILVYKRILRLKGPPLDKIQQVARDLGFIRDINVYGVDKDGHYKRQTLGPIIRTPVRIHTFQVQHLQELIPAHFFHPNA